MKILQNSGSYESIALENSIRNAIQGKERIDMTVSFLDQGNLKLEKVDGVIIFFMNS